MAASTSGTNSFTLPRYMQHSAWRDYYSTLASAPPRAANYPSSQSLMQGTMSGMGSTAGPGGGFDPYATLAGVGSTRGVSATGAFPTADGSLSTIGQLGQTLHWQMGQQQRLMDLNRADVLGQGLRIQDTASEGSDLIRGVAGRTAGQLGRDADRLFSEAGPGGWTVERSNRFADEAIKEARQTREEYRTSSLENEANFVLGMKRQFENLQTQMRNQIGPDGTPLSRNEFEQWSASARQNFVQQVSQGLNQMRESYRTSMANLGQFVTSTILEAGKTALSAGQVAQNWAQLGLAARQASASIENAGVLTALQMRLQGQETLGQYIMNSPRSLVNYFEGLLSLVGVDQSSPGLRALPALNIFERGGAGTGQSGDIPGMAGRLGPNDFLNAGRR